MVPSIKSDGAFYQKRWCPVLRYLSGFRKRKFIRKSLHLECCKHRICSKIELIHSNNWARWDGIQGYRLTFLHIITRFLILLTVICSICNRKMMQELEKASTVLNIIRRRRFGLVVREKHKVRELAFKEYRPSRSRYQVVPYRSGRRGLLL